MSAAHRTEVGIRGAVVVLGLLAAAQASATRRDDRRLPPPGRLVDVGGHRMHLDVCGPDDAPGPTVVLDAGLGSFSANWHWVQTELVHGATHESLVSRPEHAAEVVAAIRAVVTAAGAAPACPRGTPPAARPARPR